MLLGLAWERGRVPLWTLAVAGAIVGGTKFTSLLAVGVMCGVFLVRGPVASARGWWACRKACRLAADDGVEHDAEDDDEGHAGEVSDLPGADESISARRPVEYLVGIVVMLGTAFVVSGLWLAFDRMRATIAPIDVPQNQMLAFTASRRRPRCSRPRSSSHGSRRGTATTPSGSRRRTCSTCASLMTYVFAGRRSWPHSAGPPDTDLALRAAVPDRGVRRWPAFVI